MRNTTKLKAILLKYSIFLQMDEDGLLTMTLVDKQTLKEEMIDAPTYSALISKGYAYLLRELRNEKSAR